jgi:hypothetical protein
VLFTEALELEQKLKADILTTNTDIREMELNFFIVILLKDKGT